MLRLTHSRSCARPRPSSRVERGWWRSAVLSVHEQEEAPLLFTVRRRGLLWPRHEVRDAEGDYVGRIRRSIIRDRNNRYFARGRSTETNTVFEKRKGEALAYACRTAEGLELTFEMAIDTDPFAKMLLLAAALIGPEPCYSR